MSSHPSPRTTTRTSAEREYDAELAAVERAARARPGTAFKGSDYRPMTLVLADDRFDIARIALTVLNPNAERVIDYEYRLTVEYVADSDQSPTQSTFERYTEAYRHFKKATPHCSARSFLFIDEDEYR